MNFELRYERLRFKKDNGAQVVSLGTYSGSCCGIVELCEFEFDANSTVEEFAPAFERALVYLGVEKYKGIVHLTLTKEPRDKFLQQPQWFADTLAQYPGAIHGPWLLNPNSDNYIQMWMLPLHELTC